jgi:rhodanese-related sulfurtransferase
MMAAGDTDCDAHHPHLRSGAEKFIPWAKEDGQMKRGIVVIAVLAAIFLAVPSFAADDMAAKLNSVMVKGTETKFWQVSADDVQAMITAKKTDFVLIDVRPNPAEYGEGHMPGAIQITVQDIFKPESLKKLPKDKKVILVCVTGQTQNLPVVGLRALGYDAWTMSFGYSAWIKNYRGGQLMQGAIQNAAAKNYPIVK